MLVCPGSGGVGAPYSIIHPGGPLTVLVCPGAGGIGVTEYAGDRPYQFIPSSFKRTFFVAGSNSVEASVVGAREDVDCGIGGGGVVSGIGGPGQCIGRGGGGGGGTGVSTSAARGDIARLDDGCIVD